MIRTFLVLSLVGSLSAADQLLIPIDPQQYKQLAETIGQASEEGNNAAILRDGRRALELAPNDPEMRAPIYMFMSVAARNLGEVAQAEDYAAIARTLDPLIESRLRDSGKTAATRGDVVGMATIGMQVVGQIVGGIQSIRMMKLCLDMVKHKMTPPAQCGGQGQPGFQQPTYGQGTPYGQPTMYGQPGMTQTGAGVIYPNATVTSPTYQQPVAAAPQPGWPTQPGAGVTTVQAIPAQPQPVATAVTVPAQPQPTAAAPAVPVQPEPVATAQAMPAPPQAAMASQATPAQPQQPENAATPQINVSQAHVNFYISSGGYTYGGPAGPVPYTVAQAKPRPDLLRGDEEPVFKVIHDHSNMTSQNYFEQSCGALLSVSGTNLTFTASGGEAALMIPAAEIIDFRVNSLIGKDAGVFHIETRRGLYLSLAPESLDREQARSLIETIRTRLALAE